MPMLLKDEVRVKIFDLNCVETGVEAAERWTDKTVSFKMVPKLCQ